MLDGICEDCGKAAHKVSLVTAQTGGLGLNELPTTGREEAGSTTTINTSHTTARTRNTAKFTINYPSRVTATTTADGVVKTTRRRAGVTSHTSTRRAALGGGLISLPEQPSQDPLKLLMLTPEVPVHKRRCPKCEGQVNRSKGFCPACGTAYDFEPHLKAGDLVKDKYEIKGPIAFGGLGWIYLGWDQVLQRWVILKGLLNSNDEASAAAAVAERRYLAALKHPKIVSIYDFVNEGNEGFIIMEYVGGQTIHSIRKQRGPLPVAEAIAYILGILPAFAYLHQQGLVYCDFKPDNMMLEGGDVKLIDMGAVRKIADPNGDIYATVGFAAPEADTDPIAVSDLYTVGRALAVLIMDFKFSSEFEYALPSPDDAPALAENESLYRFLLRATHRDPDERFQTADEMADQLYGVLREIVALQTGPKPIDSKVFTNDRFDVQQSRASTARVAQIDPTTTGDVLTLPAIRVNLDDKAAREVVRILSLMDAEQQLKELRDLMIQYGDRAAEPRLRYVEALISDSMLKASTAPQSIHQVRIEEVLAKLEAIDPFDWRPNWYRGLWLLAQQRGAEALVQFERCYFEMPGELAPRLAMGMAAEQAGQIQQALPYYDRVGQVDPSYVSAHFGAARCHVQIGELPEAIRMLQRTPSSHAMFKQAQLAIGQIVLNYPDQVDQEVLLQAEKAVNAIRDQPSAHEVAGLLCALALTLEAKLSWKSSIQFFGVAFTTRNVRLAAESEFRQAAKYAQSTQERLYWVNQANQVRPVSLF